MAITSRGWNVSNHSSDWCTTHNEGAVEPASNPDLSSLATILRRRRSVRQFSARQPATADVAAVLRLASDQQRDQWGVVASACEVHVAISMSAQPGEHRSLFQWLPDGTFEPLPGTHRWLGELAAGKYVDAPVIVFLFMDLNRDTDRNYSMALVRAGSFAYSMWLAAMTYHMQCSVFGGASREISLTVRRLGLRDRTHIFTLAMGFEAESHGGTSA